MAVSGKYAANARQWDLLDTAAKEEARKCLQIYGEIAGKPCGQDATHSQSVEEQLLEASNICLLEERYICLFATVCISGQACPLHNGYTQ